VADHGHDAGGAVHEPGQVERVVAGVELQPGATHPVEPLGDVSGGVLDGLDLRVLREPVERLVAERDAGPPGDVVEHHRQRCALDDREGVAEHALLRGAVVVRADHEQAVGAGAVGGLGDPHRVRRVVGACTRDDHRSVADLVDDGGDQLVLLGRVGRGRLTGGAVDHEGVTARGDEVGGESARADEVDRAIGKHRRDHRHRDRAEAAGRVDHDAPRYRFGGRSCAAARGGSRDRSTS
jgi:hypothetical protein